VIGMFSPSHRRKPAENQGAQSYRKKALALSRYIWNIGVVRRQYSEDTCFDSVARFGGLSSF
jgi:hypothetical protein